MEIIKDRYYSLTEVCQVMKEKNLPSSRITLKNYAKKGKLNLIKMKYNQRYFITGQDLQEFISKINQA